MQCDKYDTHKATDPFRPRVHGEYLVARQGQPRTKAEPQNPQLPMSSLKDDRSTVNVVPGLIREDNFSVLGMVGGLKRTEFLSNDPYTPARPKRRARAPPARRAAGARTAR